ncbi:MAG: HNH endonuclease [Limisphaerales bacterium]
MDARLRQLVRERAQDRCEYCHMEQSREPLAFHVEHIIARQHGGGDTPDNLALACHHCNLRKGPNLTGMDPLDGRVVRLFHPRRDAWEEHFVRRGGEIVGTTPVGRATVRLLRMNEHGRRELRAEPWD